MSHATQIKDGSRPTHTIEDYLMTMQVLERDYGEIIPARLAEMFNVAPATVAMTLKRMERDQWITGTGRKAVRLTDIGREAAHSVIRRHMLTEWLLVKVMKIPISETHNEAHNLEHGISPQLEERMRDILGNPQVCPHGNPFPGFEHVTEAWIPLTDLAADDVAIIRRIHEIAEENVELLNFLAVNGILPGAEIRVIDVLPFNQTLTLATGDKPVTLGFPSARLIFAEKLK